jgi:hypothetical protein
LAQWIGTVAHRRIGRPAAAIAEVSPPAYVLRVVMAVLDTTIHVFPDGHEVVDAYRGFFETPGGSGNEVPARARARRRGKRSLNIYQWPRVGCIKGETGR